MASLGCLKSDRFPASEHPRSRSISITSPRFCECLARARKPSARHQMNERWHPASRCQSPFGTMHPAVAGDFPTIRIRQKRNLSSQRECDVTGEKRTRHGGEFPAADAQRMRLRSAGNASLASMNRSQISIGGRYIWWNITRMSSGYRGVGVAAPGGVSDGGSMGKGQLHAGP